MIDEGSLFLSVDFLVWRAVYNFCRKSPDLDPEEVYGDCLPTVLIAIRSYDPAQAALTTWVNRHVWHYLTAQGRLRSWRLMVAKTQVFGGNVCLTPVEILDLDEIGETLSYRARWLLKAASRWKLRKTRLIQKLRQEFAWEFSVIEEVFREIREALP